MKRFVPEPPRRFTLTVRGIVVRQRPEGPSLVRRSSSDGHGRLKGMDLAATIRWTSARAKRRHRGAATAAVAIVLPITLFFVLRPESYSVMPNGLDPIFYSAFGINFDDAIGAGAESHYFVSRWTAYYPLYIANLLGGPFVGRLVLRLILVSALLAGLWHLRPQWTWSQRILAGAVFVSMPMFLRALLTDYVEYATVTFGTGLILLALRPRQGWATAVAAGVLTAFMGIANPLALAAAAPPLFVILALGAKGPGQKVGRSLIVGVTVIIVTLFGLYYFRWVHGIHDLYQPTIDFMRNAPGRDPFKSPRLDWLGRFTWLYLPPLVVVAAGIASFRLASRLDRVEWTAVGLCGAQYVVQWLDQFARDGNGLEISYYWSMMYPALGVALALLVGRLTTTISAVQASALLAGWLLLLTVGVPDALRLPAGLWFGGLAAIVVAVVGVGLRRFAIASTTLLLALVAWTQIGAPSYDPSAYHPYDPSPRYDLVFGGHPSTSEMMYREAVWFGAEMDRIPWDDEAVFVPVGGWGSTIVGLYHAHVTGQLIGLDQATHELSPTDQIALLSAISPGLVLFGPPEAVADSVAVLVDDLSLGPPVLDRTHSSDLGYRLVVFELSNRLQFPLTLEADVFIAAGGRLEGDDMVVDAGTAAGFASFGPYLVLPVGRYVASIEYSAWLPESAEAGLFDVFTQDEGVAQAIAPLIGTNGGPGMVAVPFEVTADGQRWEFRTQINGKGTLVIDHVILSAE